MPLGQYCLQILLGKERILVLEMCVPSVQDVFDDRLQGQPSFVQQDTIGRVTCNGGGRATGRGGRELYW